MLYASDFREKARTALKGNWASAVGTGFVASLLGAGTAFLNSGSGGGSGSSSSEAYGALLSEIPEEVLTLILGIMVIFLGVILIWSLVLFIIGGPITLGYVKYNLSLVDREQVDIKDLFSQFHRFGDGFLLQFLRNLYIVLWMLVFIVPGFVIGIILAAVVRSTGASEDLLFVALLCTVIGLIPGLIVATVKEYSYTMAPYILYEHPEMSANQAITESKKLMKDNKWRFFCLGISFIGWAFLSIFTCGIGSLWLRPYQEAAYAAFYRELVGTNNAGEYIENVNEEVQSSYY